MLIMVTRFCKSTYMDNVIILLQSVYNFYKGSVKCYKETKDIADIEEHFIKTKQKVLGEFRLELEFRS